MTKPVELRRVREGELEGFLRTMSFAFAERFRPEEVADTEALLELERTVGWHDGEQWVATSGAIGFGLTVPGGAQLPAAGVTAVGVCPTHRRRGLLTAMMGALLDDARERAEPVAILFAAESPIYGRFGFGAATIDRSLRIARPYTRFRRELPSPPGTMVELAPDASAAARHVPVYAREQARRPGAPARAEAYFTHATLAPEHDEPGQRRLVVYEGPDGDEGYALYRVAEGWNELTDVPDGSLTVLELIAPTPVAAAALWRYLLDIDLMERVSAPRRPADEPLTHMLADPGRLDLHVVEGLYLALLDVPAALSARSYATEDAIVLEVEGAGAFRLEGAQEGGHCVASSARTDVAISTEALGALYLGGVAPLALAGAGRIEERTAGAVARLAAMLAAPIPPWCPFTF